MVFVRADVKLYGTERLVTMRNCMASMSRSLIYCNYGQYTTASSGFKIAADIYFEPKRIVIKFLK